MITMNIRDGNRGTRKKFASYAFNKSHATCYSWVAYQTAYLKAHYPAEYMAANMSRNVTNINEITKLMDECKAMGIKTLGPDVNESRQKFSVNKQDNHIIQAIATLDQVDKDVSLRIACSWTARLTSSS